MDHLLIIGGTSKVGTALVPMAVDSRRVSVATRTPESPAARSLAGMGAEIVHADLRDRASLDRALNGVTQVVASAHGFRGTKGNGVQSVDDAGHRALIDAAQRTGVGRFVYISAVGAGPHVPVDLYRAKWAIEQALVASKLRWTSVRATPFMESWAALVGRPVLTRGRTTVFGRGDNPINFVSAGDVAVLTHRLLDDPSAVGEIIEIGGPENLSMNEVVERFAAGRPPKVTHVPRWAMKMIAATVGRLDRPLGRQFAAGLLMDTAPMAFDPAPVLARWPIDLTPLASVIETHR